MACAVKVFQVQRVIPNLIDVRGGKFPGADFKFDDADNAAQQQNDVCALAHARNRKLEKYAPATAVRRKKRSEQSDFSEPRVPLLRRELKRIRRGERAENRVVGFFEKVGNGGGEEVRRDDGHDECPQKRFDFSGRSRARPPHRESR